MRDSTFTASSRLPLNRRNTDMKNDRTITLDNLVSLAQFVCELVKEGVTFVVWSEDVSEPGEVTSIVWHVKLTGGF